MVVWSSIVQAALGRSRIRIIVFQLESNRFKEKQFLYNFIRSLLLTLLQILVCLQDLFASKSISWILQCQFQSLIDGKTLESLRTIGGLLVLISILGCNGGGLLINIHL